MQAVGIKNITYQVFEEKHLDSVMNLWKNHSGWGEITKDQFTSWNLLNPYEPGFIILAIDDSRYVVGQETFIPSRIYANGLELKSIRVAAPILHEQYRQPDLKNPDHPAIAMLKMGIEVATKRGYDVAYSFPAYGWLQVARMLSRIIPLPSEAASFDCAGISLTDSINNKFCSATHFAIRSNGFTLEYDSLWDEGKIHLPVHCGIVRRSKWLEWKFGDHETVELRSLADNSLRGYCSIKKQSGLIEDLFAASMPELDALLKLTIRAFHKSNPEKLDISSEVLKIIKTPIISSLLEGLQFQNENFQFAFSSVLLNRNLDSSAFHTSHWYMMSND